MCVIIKKNTRMCISEVALDFLIGMLLGSAITFTVFVVVANKDEKKSKSNDENQRKQR